MINQLSTDSFHINMTTEKFEFDKKAIKGVEGGYKINNSPCIF